MQEISNFRVKVLGIEVPMVASQQRFIQRWEETTDKVSAQK